ncbi:GNAT family N-acetyltransferase [Corynebacterium glucuronolyticum]|uniref:GNAT family N-acetyltransferase n=1 Tax=Corynebacterium glucuronolyticum TaxID=39791 RepID=UPI00019C22DD|nr:GNAT family N-acetyltransferase [Corynebacterium glucuronolyticum]EEI25957.1 hypothetical protein HMPREF0294_2617 [Corynebacterium glucuronolyticum ATCC 51867]MCT1442319.1 N-acetyltransferase [Corynebacterium glucuronolyticum]MCT1563786.1 N-acetyltransferase [Corynebacterium glucuronolyticum]QRO82608.1 N-acetyltransferase [Corynebacterium glucuronolyticum]
MVESEINKEIRHDADNSRYTVQVNQDVAGYAAYEESDGVRNFNHTVIEEDYRGQGLSKELIAFALDDTREAGLKIIPTCSAVADFIAKNGEYADLIAGEDER